MAWVKKRRAELSSAIKYAHYDEGLTIDGERRALCALLKFIQQKALL